MGAPPESDRTAIRGYEPLHRVAQSYLGTLWIALDKTSGGAGRLVLLRRLHLPDNTPDAARLAIAVAGRDALPLRHDNVLSVTDVLEDAGLLAMAYEHLEAEPLRSLQSWANLRCLSFPVGVSLRLMSDLLRGVDAVHRAYAGSSTPAVFGGLAPDSVLVSRAGSTRLCDPLVASCASLLNGIGFNTAKLAYAAPEQVHAVAPLTPQSDIFTCGAMLWELLATRRLLAGSRAAIERKLLEHNLPSLGANLRGDQSVSTALAELVEQALSADPEKRPQTALEMAEQLARCGHDLASSHEVAHFVGKLSGQRFDRRTAAVRSKSLPQLEAPLEWPIELPTRSGSTRRGARTTSSDSPERATPVPQPPPLEAVSPLHSESPEPQEPPPTPIIPLNPALWNTVIAEVAAPPVAVASTRLASSTMTGLGSPRQAAHPKLAASLPFTNLTPSPFPLIRAPATAPSPSVAIHTKPSTPAQPPSVAPRISLRPFFEHDELSSPSIPSRPAPRSVKSLFENGLSQLSEATRGGWSRARRLVPRRSAPRSAWLGVLVAAVALASALIVLWLPRPKPGPEAPAVAEPAQSPEPASAAAPAELEPKLAPTPPATALPSPASADFASAKLDDRQLVELFALEQPAAIPTCAQRLGAGSQYSGNSPAESIAQLKAARREMMRGKPDSAYALLCGATAHDPTHVGAQQTLAELALQLGDAAQAKGAVERALEQSPGNATLLALLGDAVAVLGDIPGSRRIWLDTLPNGGTEADRTRRLASSYRLLGDRALKGSSFAQARNYYRRALILTEGGFAPSLGLSESLMWLGHVQASLVWAERAAQTFPKDSRVQVLFGDALYQNGQPDKARAAWQAALDVQPNNSTAARRLIQGKP